MERINRIDAAVVVQDLFVPPSMEFEKLEGYDKRFSIRLDRKYRLEFEIEFIDDAKTFGFVTICDISKHYE